MQNIEDLLTLERPRTVVWSTVFGNIEDENLAETWNSSRRKEYIDNLKTSGRKRLYPCNICVI